MFTRTSAQKITSVGSALQINVNIVISVLLSLVNLFFFFRILGHNAETETLKRFTKQVT